MSALCGYRWYAPFPLPPDTPQAIVVPWAWMPVQVDRVSLVQECVRPKGHDGPHRSSTNVTSP